MSEYLLIIVASLLLVMIILMLRLFSCYQKLKHNYALLTDQLRRHNDDVAGLCAAALAIDQHLLRNDAQLNTLNNVIYDLQHLQPPTPEPEATAEIPRFGITPPATASKPAQGYESVIAKIQKGVSIDDLVKECGLTRDEAVLLSRLHGKS